MAELVLKVGDSQFYKDGDILSAFNDRMISAVYVQHICHIKHAGLTKDGLRPIASLSKVYFDNVSKYRFERISEKEVRRINLITLEEEIFSDRPNAKGEQIDVSLFIQRRLKHARHAIFGQPGKEIWYGGGKNHSTPKLDATWNEIEAKTLFRRANHTLWPLGIMDKKVHLGLKLSSDMSDEEVSDFVRSETEEDEKGEIIIVKKRIKFVEWKKLPAVSLSDISTIEDKSVSVDKRLEFSVDKTAVKSKI